MNWRYSGSKVDDTVTQIIESRRFPTREQLYAQAGYADQALPLSFLLMYATSFGTLDKAKKHAPAHYNDAAHSANIRYSESGVQFSPRNIMGAEHHDMEEDIGKLMAEKAPKYTRAAGLLLRDNTHRLLSGPTGVNFNILLDLLTNGEGMVSEAAFKTLEKKFKPGSADYTKQDLISALDSSYSGFHITEHRVKQFYRWLVNQWETQRSKISNGHTYLASEERQYAADNLTDFIDSTRARVRAEDTLESAFLDHVVLQEYESIRNLIERGGILEFDRNLLLPKDHPRQSPLLTDLKFTLYARYIEKMFKAFTEQASKVSGLKDYDVDDERLSAPKIKAFDQRDVLTRMGTAPNLDGKISIAAKDMIILARGREAGSYVASENGPYHLVWPSLRFLYNELSREIAGQKAESLRQFATNTRAGEDYEAFRYISGKLGGSIFPRKPPIVKAASAVNESLVSRIVQRTASLFM